ncbi:DUF4138 domain-containing protein [Mucilaginibacter celer]|nr:DUF4138 domain-containing protein [Mucilaginibacter celer]
MKNILFLYFMLFASVCCAQEKLPLVYLPVKGTIHFISPEPIQYVDISSKQLAGDLPLKNILRLKLRDTSKSFDSAILTLAGEKFIAQYRLVPGYTAVPTEIEILPPDTHPLDISGIGFSQSQLKSMATNLISMRAGNPRERTLAYGVSGLLNHVYSVGDYLFLDISYRNKTRIKYDIADFNFSIEDKKIAKAANSQSIPLTPELILYDIPAFSRNYRNIFVLRKLSIPGNKVLKVELSEKQVSGRVLTLSIPYHDILDADTLPN